MGYFKMKVDIEKKRLSAIRSRFVFFEKKCESCGNRFKKEKMWLVNRWGVNNTCHTWCYCTHCMPTAEAVLHEIDTDDCFFGIYGVDENNSAFKKNMTRLNERRERAFAQMSVR